MGKRETPSPKKHKVVAFTLHVFPLCVKKIIMLVSHCHLWCFFDSQPFAQAALFLEEIWGSFKKTPLWRGSWSKSWWRRVSDSDGRCDINRSGDGRIMHGFLPGWGSGLSVRRGRKEEKERKEETMGKEDWVPFSGHRCLLEVQEEPLINYDHYYHHFGLGHLSQPCQSKNWTGGRATVQWRIWGMSELDMRMFAFVRHTSCQTTCVRPQHLYVYCQTSIHQGRPLVRPACSQSSAAN